MRRWAPHAGADTVEATTVSGPPRHRGRTVRECTQCREQYPGTARVCTDCGRALVPVSTVPAPGQPRAWAPWLLGLAVVAGVLILVTGATRLPDVGPVAGSDRVRGDIPLPTDAPTASADQLPDLRPRPQVWCDGDGIPSECIAWLFTIPEDVGDTYVVAADDGLVAVRTRQHLRAIDTRTGDLLWERQDNAPTGRTPRVWLIDGLVVTTDGATVRTFTRTAGEPVGEHQLPAHPLDTTSDDRHLYVALPAARGHLPPIQAWSMTGSLVWRQALPPTWLELRPNRILLHMGHDGLLIVDGAFGRRTGTDARAAFDPATGERIPRGSVTDRFLTVARPDGTAVRLVDTATGRDRLTLHVDGGRVAAFPVGPPWVAAIQTPDGQHLVLLELDALPDS